MINVQDEAWIKDMSKEDLEKFIGVWDKNAKQLEFWMNDWRSKAEYARKVLEEK